ncbi:amino acid ABC transporter permease [Marinomonas rhizomae]|uniref:Putative glutamine transport system permease protein GlnP n=1 Tax=Marinomonas rhizomae TaxID=491948 RepID=A0A366IZR0_9GAMM|nr:amino acid ABC transporter permease [Marinomonas rhizomae]RBP80097.1 amino acid ABC transporter membrane protein (PAAT family) [Marinomonas rhizomae]RNF72019.1 amino acid ABC transporter permease [Marinomonas rhizomae]
MEKQPHLLLWKAVFVLIMIGLGFGIYAGSKSIDYTWRWERIPQYIINTEATTVRSPFDGSATIEKGNKLVVTSDYGDDPLVIEKFDNLLVSNGDLVFEGDPLVEVENWNIGPLTWGLVMTLQLSVVSLVFAVVIGLFAGLARISTNPALRYLSVTYIELIRGTPLLVQIFIFYFFIGTVLDLDRFTAGVAALSVFTGAYIAEIVRSGIQSISPGQMEAARSLGMNYVQAMVNVILPQAFKRTLPPMAGQFINLIKDSSLVSVISITDLTKAGREVVSSTFAPFEVWFAVALMYLVLTGALSWAIQRLEKRLSASD